MAIHELKFRARSVEPAALAFAVSTYCFSRSPRLPVPPAFVIRLPDSVVEWVNVARGAPADNLVEVFGPLNEGDTIAKGRADTLPKGTKVSAK